MDTVVRAGNPAKLARHDAEEQVFVEEAQKALEAGDQSRAHHFLGLLADWKEEHGEPTDFIRHKLIPMLDVSIQKKLSDRRSVVANTWHHFDLVRAVSIITRHGLKNVLRADVLRRNNMSLNNWRAGLEKAREDKGMHPQVRPAIPGAVTRQEATRARDDSYTSLRFVDNVAIQWLNQKEPTEVDNTLDEPTQLSRLHSDTVLQYAHTMFGSSNTEVDLDFPQALERVRSPNQKAFRDTVDQAIKTTGIQASKSVDAIGDWVDGAENSVVQTIEDPIDFDHARYAAAWIGLLGNQKAVLHFSEDDNGQDSLYEIDTPETDPVKLREQLTQSGIPYRTLIPSKQGYKVLIYDRERGLRDSVSNFAGIHNAVVRESTGAGEFVGDDGDRPTRTRARATYRKIISEYESGRASAGTTASRLQSAGTVPQVTQPA